MTDLTTTQKRHSPACDRNQGPIGDQLAVVLRPGDLVWEIGSGTGQHAAAFGARFADVTWQPSDLADALPSIAAWVGEARLGNVREALCFDLFDELTPVSGATRVFCANTLHIAPWEATARLFEHARRALVPEGLVLTYGPYRYRGRPLEPSNEEFDRWLRSVDPARGIRAFEDVQTTAAERGFVLEADVEMPANNRLLFWRLVS